jgi:type II secretory pathway pseudopilin PulG
MARARMTEQTGSLPHGFTLTEAIVVLVVIVLAFVILLMMVPQGREQARLVACRKNLGQIGVALELFDQYQRQLPSVASYLALEGPGATRSPGPLRIVLETFQLPDLTELTDTRAAPKPRPGQVPFETPVPGFVCSSDPNATAGQLPAPISYRATTGDSAAGGNGAFAAGRVWRLNDIAAADGLGFTAGFAERLVGDNQAGRPGLGNYLLVTGPLAGNGCPPAVPLSAWRGDAGSSWNWSGYRSTLYNHALPPGAQPSCAAQDGQTALLGASSGHVRGVNMLLLDGSVSVVRQAIDLKVWKEFARINPPERE